MTGGSRRSGSTNQRTASGTFRGEAFNFIKHPNLSGDSINPRSANFGNVQGKNAGARVLQLSLRYAFQACRVATPKQPLDFRRQPARMGRVGGFNRTRYVLK
jgi:hypothetical protein